MKESYEYKLNHDCHCISLDKEQLQAQLAAHLDKMEFPKVLFDEKRQLFATSPVFLSVTHLESMQELIDAVETLITNKNYQRLININTPDVAKQHFGPYGVFTSYDFHLGKNGPQLIEINTNAGGVLLNAYLAMAQHACCEEVSSYFKLQGKPQEIEKQIVSMFRNEFCLQFPERELQTIAIVDSKPEDQFLYPEFQLFESLFKRHGIESVIAPPDELYIKDNQLYFEEKAIDLVYNRLTDFYFEDKENQILKKAYETALACFTPSPHAYAIYADKSNLPLLTDLTLLKSWSLDDDMINILAKLIPETYFVSQKNAEYLWDNRKEFFFKPINGFGSRGTYRGAKITKKVWKNILETNYIAQGLVPPSERLLLVDGEAHTFKLDIRCITYQGEIQQLSARLYQGQTTNLRTKGGGLASVFLIPNNNEKPSCFRQSKK